MKRELIVIAGPDKGRCFELTEGQTLVIGRGPASDTQINDLRMSRVHCRVEVKDSAVVLTDAGSSGGTVVGNQRIDRRDLNPDESFRVGETEMQYVYREEVIPRLWVLGRGGSRSFVLSDRAMTIGRTDDNTIQLMDPKVSSRHAEIVPDGTGWRIRDLGSTNGILVHGKRIDQSPLRPGVRIHIVDWDLFLDDSVVVDDRPSAGTANPPIMTTVPVIPEGLFQQAGTAETQAELSPGQSREPSRQPKETPAEKKLRVIQMVGEKLVHALDMQQLTDEIVSIVIEHVGADRVLLCLLDDHGSHIPIASHGYDPRTPPRVSTTLLRRLLEEKSGVLVKIAASDDQQIESLKAMNIESTIWAPLWTSKKIMGFMALELVSRGRTFTKLDLELLIAIAHQAALGIERARLAEVAAREQSVRSYLSKYLDEKLVSSIAQCSEGQDPLAPTERTITVLFSDIVSFSTISEGLPPVELTEFIHDYLTAMTKIVFAHGGTIDKYVGDAVMALFGAPIPSEDAALAAVRAGLAMRERVRSMPPPPGGAVHVMQTRFGISTGRSVVGNIGSEQRVEYTAIGDSVNVASRLESIAQPNEVYIDETTYQQIKDMFAVEEVGLIAVKGRAEPVHVYRVIEETQT